MSFATKMQKVATDLLTKFDERTGTDRIVLIQPGAMTWDAGLAENVFAASTETYLTGVAVAYNESTINGTTIQAGDVKLTLTNATPINAESKIRLDGKEYSVVLPNAAAYTGKALTIVYQIQIRG